MSMLPAVGRGNSCVWTLSEFGRVLRCSSEDPLPLLCSPAWALDFSAALSLSLLPSVPHSAARGRSRMSELEGTVQWLVPPRAQLVLPWEAWTGAAQHQDQRF